MRTKYTYNELIEMATTKNANVAYEDWNVRNYGRDDFLPSFIAIHAVVREAIPNFQAWLNTEQAVMVAVAIAEASDDPLTKSHAADYIKEAIRLFGNIRFQEGRKSSLSIR